MFSKKTHELSEAVLAACREGGLRLATAESCTGGLIAAALTDIAGSSDVVDRGFVTYADRAKTEVLGVGAEIIERCGAVSEEVARAMAEGALAHSPAEVSIAVTGIAGPGGGTPEKPVGLVQMAAARAGRRTVHQRHAFPGDRTAVREAAVEAALSLLLRQTQG